MQRGSGWVAFTRGPVAYMRIHGALTREAVDATRRLQLEALASRPQGMGFLLDASGDVVLPSTVGGIDAWGTRRPASCVLDVLMRLMLTLAAVSLTAILLSCSCACGAAPAPEATFAPTAAPAPPPPMAREGITVERVPGPAHDRPGDGLITLVRIDLSRFRLTLITEQENEAAWRTLPEWAEREHLAAGINAAMFEEDGRGSGLLVDEGVERAVDDPRFGGVLAFDPIDTSDAPFVMVGRDCEGVDLASLRARYRSLVANYRMLDCDGAAIAWVDESVYSSAAFARDREGRFVLIHAETEYRMRDLAAMLADPSLGLTDIHYVEGGPKASVWYDDGTGPISLVGSRHEDDGSVSDRGPRPIPNVLGVLAR